MELLVICVVYLFQNHISLSSVMEAWYLPLSSCICAFDGWNLCTVGVCDDIFLWVAFLGVHFEVGN